MNDRSVVKVGIVDAFKQRAAKRLVYFHCDHWEPWKASTGGTFSEKNADDLKFFIDRTAERDFARKLTLFYKCPLNYAFDAEPTTSSGVKVHPSDQIRFIDRRPEWMDRARDAIGYLQANSTHELQVHIHHENLTYNTGKKKDFQEEYFAKPESRLYEEARYDFLVKESLRLIREETGRPVENWLHVHGHWALNASDPDVCHLTREIEILMANGCVGDMTIPSGRSSINPRIEMPYFASPVALPKGYDTRDARPEFAYGNKKAAGSKFFIWSSIIKHRNSSLDYYSDAINKRLIERHQIALAVASESVCIDGNLFFKTHAHSMHPLYYKERDHAVHPHLHPPIVDLLGLIFECASEAGLEVVFETAGQVYERFVNAEYEPALGYALSLPAENPVVEGICPPPPSIGLAVLTRYPVQAGSDAVEPLDAEAIDRIGVETTRRLIAERGVAESGAGAYYEQRVGSGSMLAAYERELLRLLCERRNTFESCYDIGAGAGILTIALAAQGMPTVGIESDSKRFGLASAIVRKVEEKGRIQAPCSFVHARYPNIAANGDRGRSLALMTNVTTTISDDDRDVFIRNLLDFKYVLIDLGHFLRPAPDSAKQQALLQELLGIGFRKPELLFSPDIRTAYYLFEGLGASQENRRRQGELAA